jgi:suppressor of G2 allele of SKP1
MAANGWPFSTPGSSPPFPLRTDTYQTAKTCAAVLYTRGFVVSDLQVTPDERSINVEVEIDGESYEKRWVFFGEVDPKSLKIDQGKVKIEIQLQKVAQMVWPKVEAEPEPVVPLYERWSKVALPPEEEEKGQGVEFTLRKWYKDADEESRRAMMKSMVESGGTVFNPVWKEVESRRIDRYKSEEEKKKEKAERAGDDD